MRAFLFILISLLYQIPAFPQSVKYTLHELIVLAKTQSPRFKLAQTQKELKYYQYLMYKSNLNPQISITGNAPVFNKEYYNVRQPDGTIRFQSISQNNSSAGIGISQQLPFSGGQLSLNTDLTRFDDFKLKTTQYNGTPVFLRLTQPIFAFNELKWQKKIEPLKLRESILTYVLEMETIARQISTLYFDVLDAENNLQISGGNLANAEINYEIEKKRVSLGATTEDKLLQLQLQALNSKQERQKARYAYQIAQLNLKTFTGIKDTMEIRTAIPAIADFTVDLQAAITFARKYRPEFIAFERKKLEAMRDVAEAKAAQQQINLVASYGLNNIGDDIGSIYRNPNDQQRIALGFNIPMVDWGRRKARLNTVKALEKLTAFNNDVDESTIIQEITTIVSNFELLKENIKLGYITDSVAHRRFEIANNLYQAGKLSITDLYIAQSEKDNARRNLTVALRQYWDSYFHLRKLTLFDFREQHSLID